MPRKIKYSPSLPWKTRKKVWMSIPRELRDVATMDGFFYPSDKYVISTRTEHLLQAWLTGGKERYEKGANVWSAARGGKQAGPETGETVKTRRAA